MILAKRHGVRVLLLGNPHLPSVLRALGHEVIDALEARPDICRPGIPFDLRDLWDRLAPKPDVVLVADTLGPQVLPFGLEDIPVPRAYYAIDVHVNGFWQRPYAELFDVVFVAQKDYVPVFVTADLPVRWLPWGVDPATFCDPHHARIHDIAFVGTEDPVYRPKRTAILDRLRARFDIVTFGALGDRLSWDEIARVYATSKVVVNESILGDLTFRFFEAMGCGALLLTERIENGFDDLFTPGVDLDVFGPDDLEAVVERYLRDAATRERIAGAGYALVHREHTLHHRMATLLDELRRVPRRHVEATAAGSWGRAAHLAAVKGAVQRDVAIPAATHHLHRAVAEHGDFEALLALIEICAATNQIPAGLALCDQACRQAPDQLRAWVMAAELSARTGEHDAATRLALAALDHTPSTTTSTRAQARAAFHHGLDTADGWAALAQLLTESGRPIMLGMTSTLPGDVARTGLDCAFRALEIEPNHQGALEHAADVLALAGAFDHAATLRAQTVTAAPRDRSARARLAEALHFSYRTVEARHAARVAMALDGHVDSGGGATPLERARALRDAAQVLAETGAPDDAWRCSERAVLLAPADPAILADTAVLALGAQHEQRAEELLEQALALGPATHAMLRELLGLIRRRSPSRATDGTV